MKRINRVGLVLISMVLILIPIAGHSQGLTEVESINPKTRVYIDFESVERNQELIQFWYFLVSAQKINSDNRSEGIREQDFIAFNKISVIIDCKKHKGKLVELIVVDSTTDSEYTSYKPREGQATWQDLDAEESMLGRLLPHVCSE